MECDQADDTGRSQFNDAVKSQITAIQDAKSRRGGEGGQHEQHTLSTVAEVGWTGVKARGERRQAWVVGLPTQPL